MNIKKLVSALSIIFGFLLFNMSTATAQVNGRGGDVGLGVMLGEPTGISMKFWNNQRSAFDIGAAWSFGRYDALHLHGDYLLHSWFNDIDEGSLAFYYGVGARLVLSDPDAAIGIRVPLGLNYIVPDSQIDLFVEAVPILDLAPSTDFDGNGALGIRYYF
ncbi:hypothetical protein [Gracilimonas tropica]|uniref:hypothetical protein n=1 Tax=Gracilimonas tropica TaxID=454600 RepID=UPI00035FD428|nr:hypothetical protein [Gracilimonas tropica]